MVQSNKLDKIHREQTYIRRSNISTKHHETKIIRTKIALAQIVCWLKKFWQKSFAKKRTGPNWPESKMFWTKNICPYVLDKASPVTSMIYMNICVMFSSVADLWEGDMNRLYVSIFKFLAARHSLPKPNLISIFITRLSISLLPSLGRYGYFCQNEVRL